MDVDGDDSPPGTSPKVKAELREERGAGSASAERRVKVENSTPAGKKKEGAAGQTKNKMGGGAEKEGGDDGAVLAMALLLIRHAMQDTFGKAAVTVVPSKKTAVSAADKKGSSDKTPLSAEIKIDTDGAVARLRVFVVPPPLGSSQRFRPDAAAMDNENGVDGPAAGEAGWRCEVVESTRDSLRSQIMLLVERLRVAVSKS